MNKLAAAATSLAVASAALLALTVGAASGAPPAAKPAGANVREIVGMRRLTETEYRHSIADVFSPKIKVEGRFEPDVRRDGLNAIGASQAAISSSGMEQYYAMSSAIAAQIVGEPGRSTYLPCKPASAQKADDACAGQFFAKYGRLLYRRRLEDAELKALIATAHGASTSSKDFYVGIEETLTTMLASPNFLFRIERALAGKDGRSVLDGYSRAARLSFLFWDAPPDEDLMLAAESGELSSPAGLAKQVERLAASPRLTIGLTAFFDDMLQMDVFKSQTKDTARFPKYSQVLADDSRQQTIRTILHLLIDQDGDYRDIFTTRDTYLTRTLAMVYKVPYTSNAPWTLYAFPQSSPRAGVLTQVSFLSLFAHPAQSSPTKRGVAMNEIFLCQPIPPPPPDVDFSAVNGSGPDRKKTARLRLEQHRSNPTCAACHQITDPPGLALERFDALGQYRETEDGEPIDIASQYGGKTIEGAIGLGQAMHDNPRTASCLVRNLLATGLGRPPAGPDYTTIATLTKTFEDGGYRLPAFLKSAAQNEVFFSLAPPPQQKSATAAVAPAVAKPTAAPKEIRP